MSNKTNYNLKSSLKAIIKILRPCEYSGDQNFWEVRNYFKTTNLSLNKAQMLVNSLPAFKKSYKVDVYIDLSDGCVVTNGWDFLGSPEPDQILINGRRVRHYYHYGKYKVVYSSEKFEISDEFAKRYPNVLPCVNHGNTSLTVHYR